MRILQVNTFDVGGGAEAVVKGLHGAYAALGHDAFLAVKRKRSNESGVIEIPRECGHAMPARTLLKAAARLSSVSGAIGSAVEAIARPAASFYRNLGREDFDFPATRHLLELCPAPPEVLQLHNLHGNYFDLSRLPNLCRRLPVYLTLHDCWLTTGHCAHPFSCERWMTGCSSCPDLAIYPAVKRDATAFNWQRKRDILEKCRFRVAAPSRWLLDRVRNSLLSPAIIESRVIYNGVDDAFFEAGCARDAIRKDLGLLEQDIVLLFVANSIRKNEWKDFQTLQEAFHIVSNSVKDRRVVLLGLGETSSELKTEMGGSNIRLMPFNADPRKVAACYDACDVYLHAARIETFSLTIAEAQARGRPVVATEAGAVGERIACASSNDRSVATGFLVPQASPRSMAEAVLAILGNDELAGALSRNAARHARQSYSRTAQAQSYVGWFQEGLDQCQALR